MPEAGGGAPPAVPPQDGSDRPAAGGARSPAVSVVIPAHNRGDLLRRALVSLVEQSCGDFEVVVVDDGSTEDLAAVVAPFTGQLDLRLLRTGGRGGNAARNMGTDAASGGHVCYLDSDDIFLPGKIAATVAAIAERDPDILVTRGYVWRGEDHVFVKPSRWPRADEDISDYYFVADERFTATYEELEPGLAAWFRDAIGANADRHDHADADRSG